MTDGQGSGAAGPRTTWSLFFGYKDRQLFVLRLIMILRFGGGGARSPSLFYIINWLFN